MMAGQYIAHNASSPVNYMLHSWLRKYLTAHKTTDTAVCIDTASWKAIIKMTQHALKTINMDNQ